MFTQSTIMPNRYKIIKINHKIGILFFTQPMTYFSSGLPLQIIKTFQSTNGHTSILLFSAINLSIKSSNPVEKMIIKFWGTQWHFPINEQTDSFKGCWKAAGNFFKQTAFRPELFSHKSATLLYPEWQPSPLAAVSRSVF